MNEPTRPEWKKPKSETRLEELKKCREMTVEEAFPLAKYRLGNLENRDAQLNQLLDYLQSLGIPMGSETWSLRAMLKIRRLVEESKATSQFLKDWDANRTLGIERLNIEFDHARRMHNKHLPKQEIHCDWCGWDGARLIGGGSAACFDCLPATPAASGEERAG